MKAVLFDLDGTLLPMDQDTFIKSYFGRIAAKMAPHGYDPQALVKAIWKGTGAMVKNDGTRSNEAVFWEVFAHIFGEEKAMADQHLFDEFYVTDFPAVKDACGYHELAATAVKTAKSRGFRVALATNPIFPRLATEHRIRFAGLSPEDFELYTTYETIGYCKPNPDYYLHIVKEMGLTPKDCVMVGNDVGEDMIAETLGMKVFLLTDCLINQDGRDISRYPHGDFPALIDFLSTLPQG